MPHKIETVEKTVMGLVVSWEVDETTHAREWLDPQAVHLENGNVDVQGTYESLINVAGCSPEQSRQQTANYIDRYQSWLQSDWYYVTCTTQASVFSKEFERRHGTTNLEQMESVSGIEGFSEVAYADEIEKEQSKSLYMAFLSLGYCIPQQGWNSLPVTYKDENLYRPDGIDPAQDTHPLPILPDPVNQFTFRYGSNPETIAGDRPRDCRKIVLATCADCGQNFCVRDTFYNYYGLTTLEPLQQGICPNTFCSSRSNLQGEE